MKFVSIALMSAITLQRESCVAMITIHGTFTSHNELIRQARSKLLHFSYNTVLNNCRHFFFGANLRAINCFKHWHLQ